MTVALGRRWATRIALNPAVVVTRYIALALQVAVALSARNSNYWGLGLID